MSIQGAGGRSVSGGGKANIKEGDMGSLMSMTSSGTARTRRHTDAGRDTESHLAGDMDPKSGQVFGGTAGGTAVQIKKG